MKNFFLGLNMGTSFLTAFIAGKYIYELCGEIVGLYALVMFVLWAFTALCIFNEDYK